MQEHVKFHFTVLGFNHTSTLVHYFVSSPREREKKDRRDKREGQGRKGSNWPSDLGGVVNC